MNVSSPQRTHVLQSITALTSQVVLSNGSLGQHVRADGEGEVEVVQDRQSILAPMLLHEEVLEEKLPCDNK